MAAEGTFLLRDLRAAVELPGSAHTALQAVLVVLEVAAALRTHFREVRVVSGVVEVGLAAIQECLVETVDLAVAVVVPLIWGAARVLEEETAKTDSSSSFQTWVLAALEEGWGPVRGFLCDKARHLKWRTDLCLEELLQAVSVEQASTLQGE